jgi:hypothetical protein
MPRKRLTKAQGDKLLEDTKQRLRLEQEARTKARLEDLEIEVLENLIWETASARILRAQRRARVSRNRH